MVIYGLQKLTLLDYPGKTAATVFLVGCDMKCPYCHNSELARGEAEPYCSDTELFSFLGKRKGLLDGVVISGGEPCINKDLEYLISAVKDLGFSVKLDTNGFHPEVLKRLTDRGLLDYIAMDIKNSLEKYGLTTGIENPDTGAVKESINLLINGGTDYEFRTTVVQGLHTREDFVRIGGLIKGAKHYFLQQFVSRDSVPDKTLKSPDRSEMEEYLSEVRKNVPSAELRGI